MSDDNNEKAAALAKATCARLIEAWAFGPGNVSSEQVLTAAFLEALDDSAEVKRLRVWVESLRMDRQMYADLYEKRTQQARAEGVEAGKWHGRVELDKAHETIAKMAEIIRAQAALLGHAIDLPIEPSDMRPAVKP